MEVETPSGEKIYNLTIGKTLPEWLEEAKKRQVRKKAEFKSRIELIQDFYFKASCQRIKYSPNGEWFIATGKYPPSVRVYELRNLAMSFERRIDGECVQFQVLSQDATKLVFLRFDRTIEFHSAGGKYDLLRIPKLGRDLTYDYRSCDLMAVGETSQIYRFNLEKGTFLSPLESSCTGINVCGINPYHGLYVFGGEEGIVEYWDPRAKKPIGFINAAAHARRLADGLIDQDAACEISAARFHSDGLTTAIGTSTGQCLLYDLRNSEPILMKDHHYGVPIVDIKFHESTKNVISACKKIVKIWDMHTSQQFYSIEPPKMEEISDIAFKENGILFIAGEHSKINVFYIPTLGNAPSWCRFLDNLTEELEESKNPSIYTDYKFVTREDLRSLGVEKIIGSPYLRAYMHGYFMDIRLYNKIKTIAQPHAFEEWRSDLVKQKLDEKRESRITVNKRNPRPIKQQPSKANPSPEDDVVDERFAKLLTDKNYRADERGPQTGLLQDLEDYSELSEEEDKTTGKGEEDSSKDESVEETPQPEDEADKLVAIHHARSSKKSISKKPSKATNTNNAPKRKIRLFEAKDDHQTGFSSSSRQQSTEMKKQKLHNAPFGKRVEIEKQIQQNENKVSLPSNTITFKPERRNSDRRNSSDKSQKPMTKTNNHHKKPNNRKSNPKKQRRRTK